MQRALVILSCAGAQLNALQMRVERATSLASRVWP